MFRIFFAILATLLALGESRVLDCAGGRKDGEHVTRGMYTYMCRNGALDKEGCLDKPNGREYKVGQSWTDENSYQITCKVVDGYLRHVVTGCAANNRVYQAGETWTLGRSDDLFWYTCEPKAGYLVVEISGCLLEGRRIALNEEARSGGLLYGCQVKESGATGLCAIGCIDTQGGQHYIGQKWADDKHDYECTTEGKKCRAAITSCKHNGVSYKDGEQFIDGEDTYRCSIDPFGESAQIIPV